MIASDRFEDARRPGSVVGSCTQDGTLRRGVDTEGILSIDHDALRLGYPSRPGWGRHSIAYGPYPRRNGLAFGALVLNGHNTSQTDEVPDSRLQRLIRPLMRKILLRTGYEWLPRVAPKPPIPYHDPPIKENLAVGFFPSEAPRCPTRQGNAFLMHALGPYNGELWTRVGDGVLPAIHSVQNLPIYYVTVLREHGAAHYVSSLPAAHGIAPYPSMRPVGIDPFVADETVYAAVSQSVLGESGWAVDSRVYGVTVTDLPTCAKWYGTAHAADRLTGEGWLHRSEADVGDVWKVDRGVLECTKRGVRLVATGTHTDALRRMMHMGEPAVNGNARHVNGVCTCAAPPDDGLALMQTEEPIGLLHAVVETHERVTPVGLIWRADDADNFWCFRVDGDGCHAYVVEDGTWTRVATTTAHRLRRRTAHSLQVLDDGDVVTLHLNGASVFDAPLRDDRLSHATGVGLQLCRVNDRLFVHSLEAHPRTLPLPDALDLGLPWQPPEGRVVVADDFEGAEGDFEGHVTTKGGRTWERAVGSGVFTLTGRGSVRVVADPDTPCPDRTAYTVDWDDPTFADLEVEITPPGTDRGQRQTGRGALFFWQDADNYIIINNYFSDRYLGAAISSFFRIDGFEDVYNAVWSNIGDRILWGVPHRLRVTFDGDHYLVHVDEEPVLYRALSDVLPHWKRLSVRRVGIAANWEFGTDTGTVFRNFVARASNTNR